MFHRYPRPKKVIEKSRFVEFNAAHKYLLAYFLQKKGDIATQETTFD